MKGFLISISRLLSFSFAKTLSPAKTMPLRILQSASFSHANIWLVMLVSLCVNIAQAGGEEPAEGLRDLPAVGATSVPQVASLRRLPLVAIEADCRRNSFFSSSLRSPNETPLFGGPEITAQLVGPRILGPAASCQNLPPLMPPPSSPGFMRSLGRHGVASPVSPSVASSHAPPPWDQMPTAAELRGGVMVVNPSQHDGRSHNSQFSSGDFTPDPFYGYDAWDSHGELDVYGGKKLNKIQRPALEWGLPFYLNGLIPRSGTALGDTNLIQPKFLVYGDFRTAMAQNKNVGNEETIWASRLNLEFDFWLTSTERFHMFWGPLDQRNQFTNVTVDGGDANFNNFFDGWDERTDTMYFEGDLGYLIGGFRGDYAKFDMPFAVGLIPLLFQNGIWIEDAFVGAAVTIPARNSPRWDWSNFDTTLFIGVDEITNNPVFNGDNQAANLVGFTTFIERRGGYIEAGYAFVDDGENQGRSFHSLGLSYTRRYLNLLSNSMRVLANTGQSGPRDQRSADGVLLLMENSFLTKNPYNVIPYANFFAGYGTPRPAARLQGPLKNTGINFESDLLTGFPLLDDTGNNTYGAAFGVDLLGSSFEQQLILEFAALQVFDDPASRVAAGDQYAVGARYQKPLNNSILFRADVMHGWLENSNNISGGRIELRKKF